MNKLFQFFSLLLVVAILAVPSSGLAQSNFSIAVDGTSSNVGSHCSQAIVDGNPAISYYDVTNGDLKFVRASTPDGSTWGTPVTVASAGDVGQYTSLCVVNGNPAISYYDVTNGDLKFVRASTADGSAWGTPVTIDSVGDVGQFTSLCVVNGNPAIGYFDADNVDLKFVRASDASGGSWNAPLTIDISGGAFVSLAVVNGNPAISYSNPNNGNLKFIRASNVDGTSWSGGTSIDTTGGQYTSLAVVNGNPAISYHNPTNGNLKFIRASNVDGTSWSGGTAIDTTGGEYTSLAVVNGKPFVSYYNQNNGNLKYIRSNDPSGTSWQTGKSLDTVGDVGQFTSLAVVNNQPAIAYYDVTNGDLKWMLLLPEIAVSGNGTDIVSGDSTPDTADDTDFGSVPVAGGSVAHTFTISNSGDGFLSLTGTAPNYVTLSGPGASAFSVTAQPASGTVATAGTQTFTITFDPTAAGVQTANVTIPNDDANEGPFTFTVQGTGLVSTYNSASDVPVTSNGFTASGAATLALNFAPVAGTSLTVVNNTGAAFISGTFSNLAQGQEVVMGYNGMVYRFVANYYGGTGNDLVLQWKNVRPVAWGDNSNGKLGDGTTIGRLTSVNVVSSGVLAGKTIVSMAAGANHSLALCSDGTLAAWGSNFSGQLGNHSPSDSSVPVLVDRSGVLSGKTVVAIAVGTSHSLALCSDGTLTAWGSNSRGQLGDNTTTSRDVPVLVDTSGILSGKTITAIAAGQGHSMALCSDGTVAAWGQNDYGQLGNNATGTDSLVPVAVNTSGVLSGKTVVSIAAGQLHSLALCSDGAVAAWGNGGNGQLGNNTYANSGVPVLTTTTGVLAGKTVVTLRAGLNHSVALCSDGTLATWGANANGQLGQSGPVDSKVPVLVDTSGVLNGKTVVGMFAGQYHTLAWCSDGSAVSWGLNSSGQLGDNTTTTSNVPVPVSTSGLATGETFAMVRSGPNAIHSLGLVAAAPAPEIAISGNGTDIVSGDTTPATADDTDFGTMAVTAGAVAHTFTLSNTGDGILSLTGVAPDYVTLSGSGAAAFSVTAQPASGTLANGQTKTFTITYDPTTAGAHTATVSVPNDDSNEDPFTFTIRGTSLLDWTYGSATDVPVTSNGFTPAGAAALALNFAPAAGTNLTVVKNTGTGFINGEFNNVSNGSTVSLSFNGVTYPYVAWYYGGDGNDLVLMWPYTGLAAWGNNNDGQIGNGTSGGSNNAPVAVTQTGVLAGKIIVQVARGAGHTLALTSDGKVYAWGNNVSGRLGDNTTTERHSPVAVNTDSGTSALSGKTVVAIAAGAKHSLALCSDGAVVAWGENLNGKLGDNTTTNRSAPVAVNVDSGTSALFGKTVVAIAAGATHSLALCSDGTVVAWGDNTNGRLGDNTTTESHVPVAVNVDSGTSALNGKTVVAIVAANAHSLALCSDGTVAAWGGNVNGQLGDTTTAERHAPVLVNTSNGTSALYGKTVTAIAAGGHSLALCSDGTVAGWGSNGFGQLGDNTTTPRSAPVAVNVDSGTSALYNKTVVAIAGGFRHSLALCSDGTVAAWGDNSFGQIGDNTVVTQRNAPTLVNADSGTSVLAGQMVSGLSFSNQGNHSVVIYGVLPGITVEEPVGTALANGSASIDFGGVRIGAAGPLKTFTLRNTGWYSLTVGTITVDGTNAADFVLNSTGTAATLAPGDSTTLDITFSPAGTSSARTSALHIGNGTALENTFDIALTGLALSATLDTDNDGLNDWGEYSLSALGFDWQTSQTSLVAALNSGANAAGLYNQTQYDGNYTAGQNNVVGNPNPFGLYTPSQVQALNIGTPLIQRNASTGVFTLTIGVEKSTDLTNFDPFPMTTPQTTVNGNGQLEFQFTVPDNAAFFRLQSQ
ncbi:choice-of-anchor D domain-containing protein [Prosthecobacter sp.]|uniref:RCC1 domain-containing protein n=1 Tax=Prosthecobacter sp. TaxID=1965333 RepID=UPI001D7D1E3F|nr:choice-of-anchor D domain-containing protein [Prosthecobacter sp.]MCB1278053.1 choice-of-anchor D domain-containing protein [Prosthecobacter sp.]